MRAMEPLCNEGLQSEIVHNMAEVSLLQRLNNTVNTVLGLATVSLI